MGPRPPSLPLPYLLGPGPADRHPAPVTRAPRLHLGLAALAPLLLAALAGVGCVAPPSEASEHLVMFDGDGGPLRPSTSLLGWVLPHRSMSEEEYAAHVAHMMASIEAKAPRAEGEDGDEPRRVLLFIHGGLNTLVGATRRADRTRDEILAQGDWPIFINWQSSLLSSYGDHLFFVRQGEDWGPWGFPLFPIYLLQDLLTGLGQAPVVVVNQTRAVVQGIPGLLVGQQAAMRRVVDRLGLPDALDTEARQVAALGTDNPAGGKDGEVDVEIVPVDIHVGDDLGSWGRLLSDLVLGVVTFPLAVVQEPLLAGMGHSAWNILERRVYLMFHQEDAFEEGLIERRITGLPLFLRELRRLQEREGLEITLVAHSMGTIVANEILQAEPKLEVDTLIYMGAACSLADYERAVFPAMQRNPRMETYHLTLHPKGEVRETQFLNLTSRGSLLVWVDGFLARPKTPMDRTAGNFANLVLAVHRTPNDLRPRIHIKAFPTGRAAGTDVPTKHAHFTELSFWEEEFRSNPRLSLEF